MVGLETAILQKTHLSCFLFEIDRQLRAEFPRTNLTCQFPPILLRVVQTVVDQTVTDATLRQVQSDSRRTFSLVDPRLNEGFGKTLITLQPIIDELFDSIVADVSVKTELGQFVAKLDTSVLAPGEIVHRLFAGFDRVAEALVLEGRDELVNDVANGSVFRHAHIRG